MIATSASEKLAASSLGSPPHNHSDAIGLSVTVMTHTKWTSNHKSSCSGFLFEFFAASLDFGEKKQRL